MVARAYQPFSEYSHRLKSFNSFVASISDVMEHSNTAVCAPKPPLLSSYGPYSCQKSSGFEIMRLFHIERNAETKKNCTGTFICRSFVAAATLIGLKIQLRRVLIKIYRIIIYRYDRTDSKSIFQKLRI